MQPDPESDTASTLRTRERLAWAREALATPGASLVRASVDAGFRSYWRSEGADARPSRIVMDSPPAREDVRPWVRTRDLPEAGVVRVPRVTYPHVHPCIPPHE